MLRTNKNRSKYAISFNQNKTKNYSEIYIIGTKDTMSSVKIDDKYVAVSKINISTFKICNIISKQNPSLITIGAGIKTTTPKPQKYYGNSRYLAHFLSNMDENSLTKENFLEILSKTNKVDIIGISKGRGTCGVMVRWNFSGGPASHGSSKFHRKAGSVGQDTPRKLWKGTKMSGKHGHKQVTTKELSVIQCDSESILLKGAIPGHYNSPIAVRIKI